MIDLSRLRFALLRRRAAGMVEYGALAALIAVAAIGTVMMAGTRIGNLIERATDGVSSSFV
jgi:Flp pilus assembly pilin Flp